MYSSAIAHLVYALCFVVLGVAILAQPRQSRFQISQTLWLVAVYALVHSVGDFLNVLDVARGESGAATYFIGQSAAFVSYLFLYEFGRRLWGLSSERPIPAWPLGVLIALVAIGTLLSDDRWPTLHVLVGYLIRTPAGLLAGIGMLRYYRKLRPELESLRVGLYFLGGAGGLLVWTWYCGVVREPAGFFPANVMNSAVVLEHTGIPIQVYRAACGFVTTWGMLGILRIFHWEMLHERTQAAAARARLQIAMELHDGVCGTLAAAQVMAELAQQHARGCPVDRGCLGGLDQLRSTVREGLWEVRAALYSLDERDPSWESFFARLRRHVGDVASAVGLEAEVEIRGSSVAPPDSGLRLAIYRVVQEALTNAIRHASARSVRCTIAFEGASVSVQFEDDGIGLPPARRTGRGLANMERRVRERAGTLRLEAGSDGGTRVAAVLPLEPPADPELAAIGA